MIVMMYKISITALSGNNEKRCSLFVVRCSLFVRFAVRPLRYSNSAKHVRTANKVSGRTTNNALSLELGPG
jgi:hypothetical protein